ncbi:MAG: hypothetical protein AB1724_10630 [Thermodesulfobacteriota bacterium]
MKSVLVDDIFHLLQVFGDFQIGLAMRTAGPLDRERLRKALSALSGALPVLTMAFVPGRRRGRWKPHAAGDELVAVELLRDGAAQVQDFFTRPVNPCTGPQIKGLLLEGDVNYLCLNVSHFVADAAGVRELAYLLCRAYRSPDAIKPEHHDRGLDILLHQFPGRKKLGILRRTIEDIGSQLPFPPAVTLPGKRSNRFDRRYVIRQIGPDSTARLTALAAAYQATVNDVLMAAFIRSLAIFVPPGRRPAFRLVVTADLRRHLPPGLQAGQVRNLSGWVFADLGRDTGENLEATCRRVSARMDRNKASCLGMGMIPLVWLAGRGLPQAAARACLEKLAPKVLQGLAVPPSFTNMGRLDPQALMFDGRPVEEAYLLPPVVHAPILGVGVSRYRDTMTLSSGFNVPGFSADDVTALLDGIAAEIHAA